MNKTIRANIIRFIGLILLQGLLLNQLNFLGYLNPMVYIVWVMMFPFKKNKTPILILSFLLGLCIDFFSDSGGIHAAATLFIAYFRVPLLKILLRKTDFDYLLFNLKSLSLNKLFGFILWMTLIHHFVFFSLSYFRFEAYLSVLSNTFFTGLFTIFLSTLGMIIFTNKK